MKATSLRTLLAVLVTPSLAACQSAASSALTPSFGLSAWTAPADPAQQPAPPAVAVHEQAAVPAPKTIIAPIPPAATGSSSGGGGSGSAGSAATGTITVELGNALRPAARRVLALPTEVDHVMVLLTMPGQPDRAQVVSQAQILAGTTSVTFGSLPAGTATVTITAFDGVGTPLGLGTRAVPVATGIATPVAIDVPIDPEAVAVSASGNVSLDVTFSTGAPGSAPTTIACPALPLAGKVVATSSMPSWGLQADNRGHLFSFKNFGGVPSGNPYDQGVIGIQMSSAIDGSKLLEKHWRAWLGVNMLSVAVRAANNLAFAPATNTLWTARGNWPDVAPEGNYADPPPFRETTNDDPNIALDAAGNAIMPYRTTVPDASRPQGERPICRVGRIPAGGGDVTVTTMEAMGAVAFDAAGNIWAGGVDDMVLPVVALKHVRKYAPDESALGTFALPIYPQEIKGDALGNVWIRGTANPSASASDTLLKLSPSGQVLVTLTTPVADFCLDGNQALWVATRTALLKFAQDGTPMGQLPIAATNVTFGDGYIYAGDTRSVLHMNDGTVSKIAP